MRDIRCAFYILHRIICCYFHNVPHIQRVQNKHKYPLQPQSQSHISQTLSSKQQQPKTKRKKKCPEQQFKILSYRSFRMAILINFFLSFFLYILSVFSLHSFFIFFFIYKKKKPFSPSTSSSHLIIWHAKRRRKFNVKIERIFSFPVRLTVCYYDSFGIE